MSVYCLQIYKKKTKYIYGFLTLPLKRGQIKNRGFFNLTSFGGLEQKFFKNIVVVLVDLKKPKGHFEIN
jgi:hypothetical protein